jgi:N utilization substance protein A
MKLKKIIYLFNILLFSNFTCNKEESTKMNEEILLVNLSIINSLKILIHILVKIIAVDSYDDRIDPVGACVGMKGSRIHGIVRELGNENIDVINYTTNASLLITRALSPAKVSSVKIDEEKKRAEVFLKLEEVSKAIGRGGHNIKLAGLLTGYELDVIREGITAEEDDVELTEFSDEIDGWVIDEFAKIGLDTARSILNQDVADLVRRTDLEEETILEVIRILKDEFED